MPDFHEPIRVLMYYADAGPHAPEGPGWYVVISRKEEGSEVIQEIVPHVRISGEDMEKLGQVMDNFIKGKPQNWRKEPQFDSVDMSVREAVRVSNEKIAERIRRQIIETEGAIARLELLKKRHDEFSVAEDDET